MKFHDYLLTRKARILGIKINHMERISASSAIYAETPISLGSTRIINDDIERMSFGAYSYVRSGMISNVASIGRFCSIGQNVTLGQSKRIHPVDWASNSIYLCTNYQYVATPTVIENDIWIGQDVVVMEGVTVGNGAIIGRNSVVTKDVLPYQIVAGNPARPIRFRFEEALIEQLLHSQWWTRDIHTLRQLDYKNVVRFTEQVSAIQEPAIYPTIKITRNKITRIDRE
ncbi:MAG: CatB-related O-acetyltransferase [Porticoccus sp.]|uniref:CatB-related O-acetyltransferase n=1 Tax=Porticoccus sp. TaxID=2024853 RepID=UPI003299CB2B